MSLFPFLDEQEVKSVGEKETVLCEYDYDFKSNKIKDTIVYGVDALKVWIYKALLTNRYRHTIYSWDYGQEIENLIGKNYNNDLIAAELKRLIEECLIINPYILGIYNFECIFKGNKLTCNFFVRTKLGEVNINDLSYIRRDT